MSVTYLLLLNGKPEGPFTMEALTGKYLRAEVELTAEVCHVGASTWQSLESAFNEYSSMKVGLRFAVGLPLVLAGLVLGLQFADSLSSKQPEQMAGLTKALRDSAIVDEVNADLERSATVRALMLQHAQERKQSAEKVRAELEAYESKRTARGVGAAVCSIVGIGFCLSASIIKNPQRPPNPTGTPQPSIQNISTSQATLPSAAVPLTSTQPATPVPLLATTLQAPSSQTKPSKPRRTEPTAFCGNCQQKIAFPAAMAGQMIACPTCGTQTTLDDVSNLLD